MYPDKKPTWDTSRRGGFVYERTVLDIRLEGRVESRFTERNPSEEALDVT